MQDIQNAYQGESPPRMRGKGPADAGRVRSRGITPAYAGKSPSGKNFLQLLRDHPRVCGEKELVSSCNLEALGSPPRMRGKETCKKACEVSWGITPAYAGKSRPAAAAMLLPQDHPRVCGEKNNYYNLGQPKPGSPPRMRGKDTAQWILYKQVGITPAYAGKRVSVDEVNVFHGDHPRVCGEKRLILLVFRAVTGSPPRMRGKEVDTLGFSCSHGITPACAGKSYPLLNLPAWQRDHPRVCGEKYSGLRLACFHTGSPPRVRGKEAS